MIDNFIQDTAKQAGKITLEFFKKAKVQYTKSHLLDVVTQADIASNTFIVDSIKSKFPTDGIISEETGEFNIDAESVWIIDPLDGTLNFSKGIPLYCVLIAHSKNGVIDCGVIYDPVHDDLLFASKGKGAYLNGEKILCSETESLELSVGCANSSGTKRNIDLLGKLSASTEKQKIYFTSLFSIGICAAQVASGKRDWFISLGASVWDYAAGSIILEESGCIVTNIHGEIWKTSDKSMIAANPVLHGKILDVIKDIII